MCFSIPDSQRTRSATSTATAVSAGSTGAACPRLSPITARRVRFQAPIIAALVAENDLAPLPALATLAALATVAALAAAGAGMEAIEDEEEIPF